MDYLIGMPISSSRVRSAMLWWLTQKTKEEELEVLKGTTSVAIWMRELDELRTELLKDVKWELVSSFKQISHSFCTENLKYDTSWQFDTTEYHQHDQEVREGFVTFLYLRWLCALQ
jgi:hypothetical protein